MSIFDVSDKLIEQVVKSLAPRSDRSQEKSHADNVGLKVMRANYSPTQNPLPRCPNCRCVRYNPCGCMKKGKRGIGK